MTRRWRHFTDQQPPDSEDTDSAALRSGGNPLAYLITAVVLAVPVAVSYPLTLRLSSLSRRVIRRD